MFFKLIYSLYSLRSRCGLPHTHSQSVFNALCATVGEDLLQLLAQEFRVGFTLELAHGLAKKPVLKRAFAGQVAGQFGGVLVHHLPGRPGDGIGGR